MPDDRPGVSLAIPFYNEEAILAGTLAQTWEFMRALGRPFELVLGDDGSTDGSLAVAERFAAGRERCRIVRNPVNTGKGRVLRRALAAATQPLVAFIDADLQIPLVHLGELIAELDDPAVQLCVASKLLAAGPSRARHRRLGTWTYNRLVRALLGSRLSDHQCGLKGFRREVIHELLPLTREDGWAWDTELLLLALGRGYAVREIPIELAVIEDRESRVSFLASSATLLGKLIEFRRRGLAV